MKLTMKVGATEIFARTVSTGENTIVLTDDELDNLYKLYGNSNSLTAIFVLITADNYTNEKTCIITLTGKQKTVYTEINGQVKRAEVFVEVDGKVKRAVVFVGVNKVPKRCI